MSEVVLRDYQERAVQRLRDGIRAGHRKQVLMAPTGAGKTEVASFMLQEAARKRSRSLFIVDRVNLVTQTSERLDKYKIPHGIIQAGHWRRRDYEPIQVCSAQTVERRGIPEDCGLVFVDECHTLRKAISEYLKQTEAIVIGLSATPLTRGMGQIYTHLVSIETTNALIERKFIVPLKAYAARAIDVAGMKVVAGEWSEKEIEQRGMEIIGDIVAEWQAKTTQHFGGPVKTIVFSATVEHGEELCKRFREAGFNFQQISYRDGNDDSRGALISEFRRADSSIHGLISCEVFTKGFDVPDVMCGISARPYRKSLSSHIQQLGRVMRAFPGKEFGLWLDHSGNYLRFKKDVDDIFANGISELDDGKREEKARKEPTEKEREEIRCSCGYVMQAWETKCPACGKERKRLSMVETLPGELVAVDGKKAPVGLEDRQKVWTQLCAEAMRLKPGQVDNARKWALAQFKSIYDTWPHAQFQPYANAPLSNALHNRLIYQRIRFARSQRRGASKPVPVYNR